MLTKMLVVLGVAALMTGWPCVRNVAWQSIVDPRTKCCIGIGTESSARAMFLEGAGWWVKLDFMVKTSKCMQKTTGGEMQNAVVTCSDK
jgi:hypothetical protein